MKYYQVTSADRFKIANLAEGLLYEDFYELGKPHTSSLSGVINVVLVDPDHRSKCVNGNAWWFSGGGIVLSEQAVYLLKSLLTQVELIPLMAGADRLFYLNPPHLHCVDLSNSEYLPCPVTGEPLIFTKYVLRAERCAGYPIFRMPGRRTSPVFVNEEFTSIFSSNSLLGIGFEEVASK